MERPWNLCPRRNRRRTRHRSRDGPPPRFHTYGLRAEDSEGNDEPSSCHQPSVFIAMKSRCVSFFVEEPLIPEVVRRIQEDVLPRFSQLPHFLGFVALQSELSPRPEIVAMSFWDDGLEDSEAISDSFRSEIQNVTGTAPARRAFDVLRVMVRDTNGDVCLDSP